MLQEAKRLLAAGDPTGAVAHLLGQSFGKEEEGDEK